MLLAQQLVSLQKLLQTFGSLQKFLDHLFYFILYMREQPET